MHENWYEFDCLVIVSKDKTAGFGYQNQRNFVFHDFDGNVYVERKGISLKRFTYLNSRKNENKIPFNFDRFREMSDKFDASDHCPLKI